MSDPIGANLRPSTVFGDLIVRMLPGGVWELVSDLSFFWDEEDSVISVPRGFKTDFASVPRLPVIYLAFAHHAHIAAVFHDYALSVGWSRSYAHNLFVHVMRAADTPPLVQKAYAFGVAINDNRYIDRNNSIEPFIET